VSDQLSSELGVRLSEAARAEPSPIGECSGRGIVICAGGTRLFTCAWVLIAMLRRTFGCRLPVEVWHIGPAEIGPPMRALLEAFDVRVIDALKVLHRHPVETLGGWQLKTYALMHSDFQEILLIDADNMPVSNPAFLFETGEYLETGALFWPDIVRLKASNPIWQIARLPVDPGASFETGQILIDKKRHWRALTLANWINQNHLAFEDMLYGDKDACYIAWRMLGYPYHLIRHAPKLLEHTMVQRSPGGDMLFQHRNGAKWLLSGPNPRIEGFQFETECFMLLAELRMLWDGAIFNPPDRSAAAHAAERDFVRLGRFRLIWVGWNEHLVTFRPQHVVEGCVSEHCWFVADGVDGLELRLVARGILSCALRRSADAIWRGTAGHFVIELHPEIPDFLLGMDSVAAASSNALLAMADKLLDCASTLSGDDSDDLVITLATLARLDAALPEYLETCAKGPSNASALARTALARYRSGLSTQAALRPGTGWQAISGNIGSKTEALPKR
jgi:hypothetical protein